MDDSGHIEDDDSPRSDDMVHVWRCPAERALQTSSVLSKVAVSHVAISLDHLLFLTSGGQIYSQGSNQSGQLGLGHLEDVTKPQLISSIQDEHVVEVACGAQHSAAVTTSGHVICWGANRAKQCGQDSPDILPTPTRVQIISCQHAQVQIQSVSCGEVHTLALDSLGQIWAWGTGTQLGLPNIRQTAKPMMIDYFTGRKVIMISCGDLHNVALVEKVKPQVQVHKYEPSTCKKCKQEIYTMVEQSDICIITDDHKCPLGVDLTPQDENIIIEYPDPRPRSQAFSKSICHLVDEDEAKKFLERQLSGEFPRRKSMIREKMADIWDSVLETPVGSGVQSGVSGLTSVVSSGLSNVTNTVGSGISTVTSKMVSNIRGFEVFGSPSKSIRDSNSELEWNMDTLNESQDDVVFEPKTQDSASESVKSKAVKSVDVCDIELSEMKTTTSSQNSEEISPETKTNSIKSDSKGIAEPAVLPTVAKQSKPLPTARKRVQAQRTLSHDSRDVNGDKLERRKSYDFSERQSPIKSRSKVEEILEEEVRVLDSAVDTEVWSWGKGRQGQLGHGDMLERAHPCCIKALCNKRIVKVVAGAHHVMALTANSEVYSWGDNQYYQLGHKDSPSTNPRLVVQHAMTWDVAAGPRESLLLNYFTSPHPEICFCGIQDRFITGLLSDTKMGSESTTAVLFAPKRLSQLKRLGLPKRVSAGHNVCAAILDKTNSSLHSLLHEVSLQERSYLRNLENILRLVIKPVIISESYQANIVNSAYGDAMTSLLDQYDRVIKLVSMTTVDVTSSVQSRASVTSCRIVTSAAQFVKVYAQYACAYDDVTAMAGFQHVAELAGPLLEKLYDVTSELVPEEVDLGCHVTLLQHLFSTPIRHVREYSRTMKKLALHFNNGSEDHAALGEAAVLWDSVRDYIKQGHTNAENTCKFWTASVNKNIECLRVPGRRLLRDSRQASLTLQNAGRFTNHQFLLFSDVFVHVQYSSHVVYALETIWVEALTEDRDDSSEENGSHGFVLVTPEDRSQLVTPGPSEKNTWFWTLNKAIDEVLSKNKHHQHKSTRIGANVKPPISRHANHVFTKGSLRGASYSGMWILGKMDGQGELTWPDGRRYTGKFRQGLQHGYGCMVEPKGDDLGIEVYDGYWVAGKRNGHGQLRYGNGDVYDGMFKEGLRQGHGILKQGSLKGREASLYIGEWLNDKRHGYGVLDDILKGEKYMCMWADDQKHGCGVIVTLDGMYFEGNFSQNKITGFGLLLTEDNCCYEGEFQQGMALSGKGTMTLVNGDVIEGTFHGTLADGVKISGTYKRNSSKDDDHQLHKRTYMPRRFSKLSVPAERKWHAIFSAVETKLQLSLKDTKKAWEQVAVMVNNGKKIHGEMTSQSVTKIDDGDLETIPVHNQGILTVEHYTNILSYLKKSLSVSYHPLGGLMNDLIGVYRATYVGMGAHARLLLHAVTEIAAYIKRLYKIIRLLFPELPEHDLPVQVYPHDHQPPPTDSDSVRDVVIDEDEGCIIFTPTGMLYTFLLPRIYPPLFTLYALYNEKDDDRYLERIQRLNRQTDLALMAYLGVDQRFWHVEKVAPVNEEDLFCTLSRDQAYREAVEALQQMSTAFCPSDKLHTIRLAFRQLNLWVERKLGSDYLWSMDELFPVFQYVVIRARIRHLGAEIHFIDDLMEPHLELGELGLMFTTLKASYFQIQTEKIVL